MKIEELMSIRVTPPKPRERKKNDYWNLEKKPELKAAIERVLAGGPAEYVVVSKEFMTLYHVRPGFPLVGSAMKEKRNQSLLKVSIAVYAPMFHVGVRGE